jgi:SAM-dependent methyltransferase
MAGKAERTQMYTTVYDELFSRVEDHPGRTRERNPQRVHTQTQLVLLEPFLRRDTVYLEIGAGNGALASQVAERVRQVYAIEISPKIIENAAARANLTFLIAQGVDVPLGNASVDVAFSNQLLEHLHPEDAQDHMQHLYRVLKHGGSYICVTPNRLTGPHDISLYFDDTACGFHLKEYTMTELCDAMVAAGFRNVRMRFIFKGRCLTVSAGRVRVFEDFLQALPLPVRRGWLCSHLISHCAIGTK